MPESEPGAAEVGPGLLGGKIDNKEKNSKKENDSINNKPLLLRAEKDEQKPEETPKHKTEEASETKPKAESRYADRFHPAKIVLDRMRMPSQRHGELGKDMKKKKRWTMTFSLVRVGKGPRVKPSGRRGWVRIPVDRKVC